MIKTANLTGSVSRNAGGLFESVRRLVQSLAVTGVDVHVFGVQDKFTAEDVDAWNPVTVSAFRSTWPESFGYSRRFLEELGAYAPDLTHTHGIWSYPSVATNHYCCKKGIPYLISAHGMLDPWAIRNSRWKKVIAYFLYEEAHLRGAHCLRALCESEAHAIRQVGLKNPIAIIPNGIDMPEVRSGEWGVRNPPWQGMVEPGRKVLLYLGRIHPKKGLVNLLKASAWVQAAGRSGWVLAIAGWDQCGHEGELKRLATELGIPWADVRGQRTEASQQGAADSASVLFLGPQFNEAKAACYRDCDAFILPSFSEGVPMVVLEAWANSKPVLMTPECNLPEGFARRAALRIETSPESIAQGLGQLFEMVASERTTMGRNGYALAADRFAWPRIAEEMKRLYEWMLGGGQKPVCLADF